MADRGPHNHECATATGGDCHCDCHGTMHGILRMPRHRALGAKHGSKVTITPAKGGGGKITHYKVTDTATGLPPGGGTRDERVASRSAQVTVTASSSKAADFHRWHQHSSLPGRKEVHGPSPREKNIARYQSDYAAAVENLREVTAAAQADMKRRRVPTYKRPGELERATREAQWTVNIAQRDLDAARTLVVHDNRYDQPEVTGHVRVQPVDPQRPLAVYGDMLHLHDESDSTHRNVADLEKAPAAVHAAVADHLAGEPGGGVYVGDSMIPELDDLGYLRNDQPRGWHAGDTFAKVPGVYVPAKRVVAIGHAHKGHGSQSVALHEFGHGADAALGRALGPGGSVSDFPAFVAVHNRLRGAGDAKPYFLQSGTAGRSEAWAEAFAAWAAAKRSGGEPGPDIAFALGTPNNALGQEFARYFDGLVAQVEAKYGGA